MKLSKEQRNNLSKEEKKHYKTYGVLPQPVFDKTVDKKDNSIVEPIVVLCVRYGKKYNKSYVERLRNMVKKYLTLPYEFVCLTDDPEPISGVRLIYQPASSYTKLWWHKVHMFDPTLPIKGRILYFDLDVIICNNINKLVENLKSEFMGIRDFNRKFHPNWKYLNSSVMSWNHGEQFEIWNKFRKDVKTATKLHGDQDWIFQCARSSIKFWPIEWILSYKWEIRSKDDLILKNGVRSFRDVAKVKVPQDCSVVVFHGDPKPEDIKDPFVVDNWR
jgi:hypothetical protein